MKTQLMKIYRMQWKQCLEGNVENQKHILEKKNDLKSIAGFYFIKLMKEEQFKLKAKRRKEIIKKIRKNCWK